jgi:hypothetical protein
MFGGRIMIRAVKRVIREVTISLAESIPSAITARLPEMIPMTILSRDKRAFPITPTQDALTMIFG